MLQEALKLREEQGELSSAEFAARRRELEGRLDALIAEGRKFTDPDNARLAKRLRKQRKHLLTFLDIEGVEPTNNRAERALRPAVIVRKTGGCNRTGTGQGARTHAVLASLLVTAKKQTKQGLNPVNYLAQVLRVGSNPSPLRRLERPPLVARLA